jgi:signal transduction histidine kinase
MSEHEPVHFLLVDDLAENLLALEALLQREGLTCLKARSGEEALELLLVHDVAMALLDVQMPGMDGFELAEFMRGNERTRHVPIIFLTAGSADMQRRFRGYEAGAVDFLQKPLEADILRSKAAVFFDLHQQRRQIMVQRDELEALAAALRTADRRKNEFLAMLGHELRNPIMALGAGLHLLERREGTDRAREVRGRMGRHVDHLGRLVEDLLDIARIDQGKISLKMERLPLQEILSFAMESSEVLIEGGQHELVQDIAPDPIWLDADRSRIAQVVSNLLNNAAKYTPQGGRIGLSARIVDGQAQIEVTDTGMGIPIEMQARIFDLFAQVHDGSGKRQDGLGIGLALVRQLVELHGGTIRLRRSVPGEGSIFQVMLPLPDAG